MIMKLKLTVGTKEIIWSDKYATLNTGSYGKNK